VLGIAPVIGVVVGFVVGLTSTGGGALLTPALVLLMGVPPSRAVGSDVLAAAVMKLFGGGVYAARGEVDRATVGRLAMGSLPGAAVGVALVNHIPVQILEIVLRRGLGGALVLAGVATLVRIRLQGKVARRSMPSLPVTVCLGFVTGTLVAITSVGSGSLLLCVMTLFFPLRGATMVGTDLVHALILSSAATVGHFLSGRVDVVLAGSLLLGGVPGVILGARFASHLPERALRVVLAAVLIVTGASLALRSPAASGPRSARIVAQEPTL
jgi:uncharacterized membrane protein YfcA